MAKGDFFIVFQKQTDYAFSHNFREKNEKSAKYTFEEFENKNEYWRIEKYNNEVGGYPNLKKMFDDEVSKSKRKGGRIPKLENSCWECVLKIGKNHNIEDLKKVSKIIDEKFNITTTSIALHKDEGHYNDKGEWSNNFHAHLTFMTYKDGKQNWRQSLIRDKLSDLQRELAKELGFNKSENGRKKNLSHKEFKAVIQSFNFEEKEIKKEELLTNKEKIEIIEKFRKKCINKNYSKEFFRELTKKKKEKNEISKEQIEKELEELAKSYKGILGTDYKKISREILEENEALKSELSEQKEAFKKCDDYFINEALVLEEKEKNIQNKINKNNEYVTNKKIEFENREIDLKERTEYLNNKSLKLIEKEVNINNIIDEKVKIKNNEFINSLNEKIKELDEREKSVKKDLCEIEEKRYFIDQVVFNENQKIISEYDNKIFKKDIEINRLEENDKAQKSVIDKLEQKVKEVTEFFIKAKEKLENFEAIFNDRKKLEERLEEIRMTSFFKKREERKQKEKKEKSIGRGWEW